jgi:hypothetical protein
MVPPGEYRVRLAAGDWSATTTLRVLSDPRVAADGVTDRDLGEQYLLALRARDALGAARRTAAQVQELRRRTDLDPAARRVVEEAHAALVTASGAYPTPMLVDQLSYLYGMLTGADQRPGRDAHTRLAELERRHAALVERLRAVPGWGAER